VCLLKILKLKKMNRRTFIEKTTIATAAFGMPSIVPVSVFGSTAPSNRITVGVIGTGRQGFGFNLQGGEHKGGSRFPGLLNVPDAQVVAVCDVDSWRMEQARLAVDSYYAKNTANGKFKGCSAYTDFRDILSRRDIDAVMISTPDFWHVPMAILAAKAKKHVSCEKPLSMSVQQGRQLVEVLKKTNVINRTDSEFRSMRSQNLAVELVRNGRIGKLQKIEISFPSDPTPVPTQVDMPIPKGLNYDLWLGPMPHVPYTDNRVHMPNDLKSRPGWMRVDNYAQGMIANWGAHYFDIAQWANNSEYDGPIEVEGNGEFPRSLWNTMMNFEVKYRYANGVEMVCRQTPTSTPSICFIGTDGWIKNDNAPGILSASNPKILESKPGAGELDLSQTLWDKTDFIQAIKEGRNTLEPIEVGHRTISISQIGLIACQTGEKLTWEPATELFKGNNAANSLLAAPNARKEWTF